MENKKQNKVFVYQAAILMITTFLSRIFGLVREVIIAYLLGISGISDAFLASFKITNFLRIFLGEGALGGAFIPVYTETIEKEGREEADKLASNVLNIMCVILVLCTILGIVAAPLIIKITTGGMPVQLQRIAVNLTRIMFSYLIFIGLAGLVMVVLNSLGHFIIPSLNPIMFSISIISCGIFLSKKLGAGKALALGVLIGGILQFLIQLPVLKKYDFKYFLYLILKKKNLKK